VDEVGSRTDASGTEPMARARTESAADVKVCPKCNGSGEVGFTYNYREMKKVCDACKGERFQMFRDGKPVQVEEDPSLQSTSSKNPYMPKVMTTVQRCEPG
jgi:DnaJ-class molecular chaperone